MDGLTFVLLWGNALNLSPFSYGFSYPALTVFWRTKFDWFMFYSVKTISLKALKLGPEESLVPIVDPLL